MTPFHILAAATKNLLEMFTRMQAGFSKAMLSPFPPARLKGRPPGTTESVTLKYKDDHGQPITKTIMFDADETGLWALYSSTEQREVWMHLRLGKTFFWYRCANGKLNSRWVKISEVVTMSLKDILGTNVAHLKSQLNQQMSNGCSTSATKAP